MFLNTVSEAKKLHLSKEDVLKVYDAVKFNDRDCSSPCLFFGLNSAQFKSLFQFLSALQISEILALSNSFEKNVMFTNVQWITHINDHNYDAKLRMKIGDDFFLGKIKIY